MLELHSIDVKVIDINDIIEGCAHNFKDNHLILSKFNFLLLPVMKKKICSRLLERIQGDSIVHIHGASSILPFIFSSLSKEQPWVFSPHYHPVTSRKLMKPLRILYDAIYTRQLIAKVNAIVFVSPSEKASFEKDFHFNSHGFPICKVIPNGAELEGISTATKFNMDRKIVLSVGRLEKYKRIDLVIRAMNYLPKNFELFIVGTGSDLSRLERIAKNNSICERISFLGSLNDEMLFRWYKTAWAYVNLSEMEAFGISVIEALASGIPCVVRKRMGLSDIGNVFPKYVQCLTDMECRPESIAKAIIDVDHLGVPPGIEKYSWQNISEIYTGLYESIHKEGC